MHKFYYSNTVVVAETWKSLAHVVDMLRRRCFLHWKSKSTSKGWGLETDTVKLKPLLLFTVTVCVSAEEVQELKNYLVSDTRCKQ